MHEIESCLKGSIRMTGNENGNPTKISNIMKFLEKMKNQDSTTKGIYNMLIEDILKNFDRQGKSWSNSTMTLFATILDYEGKLSASKLTEFLKGPSLSTIYRKAKFSFRIQTSIEEQSFIYSKQF